MSIMIRKTIVALAAVALVSLAGLASPRTASAQCPNITVHNATGVPLQLCLYDALGAITCNIVPAGASALPPFNPIGAWSAGHNLYPFNPAPPAIGCTPCVTIHAPQGAPDVCATVCYDPNTCTVTITPCNAPCLP